MGRTEVQNTASGWTWLCFECGVGGIAGGEEVEEITNPLFLGPGPSLYERAKTSAVEHQCAV